jgi:hypothetical protein
VSFLSPPRTAAWLHREALQGFEVVFFEATETGYLMEGQTAAVEEGEAYAVGYTITLDREWRTRRAEVRGLSSGGRREVVLEADGRGSWLVDGVIADAVEGCLDVDIESSALTNAFPVHRLALAVGASAAAPAAYVRAVDLRVERLEQSYERLPSDDHAQRYRYESPGFDFVAELEYDEFGLIRDYPGIAVRVL